jgi:replicative DNA helicase
MKTSDTSFLLPVNLDAERLVLGAILTVENCFPPIADVLSADDFSTETHRRIWRAVEAVHAEGKHVDQLNVSFELEARGFLESVTLAYLIELDSGLPQIFHVDDYCRTVKEYSVRRKAIAACEMSIRKLLDLSRDPQEVLQSIENSSRDFSSEVLSTNLDELQAIGVTIPAYNGSFLDPKKHSEDAVPTPWPSLTDMIVGFHPKELTIVAGRTSSGKTAFALQIAQHAAAKGKTAALFSMEMGKLTLLHRLVCSRAMVDSHKFRLGLLDQEERKQLFRAANELCDLPLYIDDTPGMTLASIQESLRKLSAKRKIDLVVIDYLQLINYIGRSENRTQEVSKLSRGLKLLAGAFDVPVIALAQLSRGPDHEKRRPRLHDLRESGTIEQDADVVLFIHAEQSFAPCIPVELIIAKQRKGPLGKLHMAFHRQHVQFVESTGVDDDE